MVNTITRANKVLTAPLPSDGGTDATRAFHALAAHACAARAVAVPFAEEQPLQRLK